MPRLAISEREPQIGQKSGGYPADGSLRRARASSDQGESIAVTDHHVQADDMMFFPEKVMHLPK
jgi:hypothetical protein